MTTKRTTAREAALQLLFTHDLNDGVVREDVLRYVREQLPDPDAQEFAMGLYDGTLAHQADIDTRIRAAAENWRLERIAILDRNALRLGAYELMHGESGPAGVVMNEAIELARTFGSAESPGFVNAVLDRMFRDWTTAKKSAEAVAAESPVA
jgi:transcription antitermination protein NusB